MVGDRVGTDLWGAYLAGIKYRILVKPYSKSFGGQSAGVILKILKFFENLFL
jgi:predicted HAD superfamily phosphohydrolase YqeG